MSINFKKKELYHSINIISLTGSYELIIGKGLQPQLLQYISTRSETIDKIIIITDQNVADLYLNNFETSIKSTGIPTHSLVLEAGEKHKTFNSVFNVCKEILDKEVTRQTLIIILGGGVTGDIAGFVSSIILRGLNYIQIPTTLLSQIDSSIGGKTGVNTSHGKNLLGTFYPPNLVIVDVNYLDSLSEIQMKSGYVELLKHALINDKALFEELDNGGAESILTKNKEAQISLIYKSVMVKINIVSEDEKEQGARKLLNFGHTFAHALERIVNYNGDILPHGYAVSIGIVLASELSYSLGKCSKNVPEAIYKHLKKIDLPTSIKDIIVKTNNKYSFKPDEIISAMTFDKKRNKNGLGLVLLSDIGDAFSLNLNSTQQIYNVINQSLSI